MCITEDTCISDRSILAPPPLIEGDYVVACWTGAGKHTGVAFDDPVVGKLEQPSTGKEVYFSGATMDWSLMRLGKSKL